MAQTTHYEILVKQKGRWEIHARHSHSEKEIAIEKAKALDGQKHIEAVKVIQEVFDPEAGTTREYNVYAPGQKAHNPAGKAAASRSGKGLETADTGKPGKKTKNLRSFSAILIIITAIVGASSIIGGLFTWFTGMYLADMDISGNARINILFMVFVATFVIAAIPMAIVFLAEEKD